MFRFSSAHTLLLYDLVVLQWGERYGSGMERKGKEGRISTYRASFLHVSPPQPIPSRQCNRRGKLHCFLLQLPSIARIGVFTGYYILFRDSFVPLGMITFSLLCAACFTGGFQRYVSSAYVRAQLLVLLYSFIGSTV